MSVPEELLRTERVILIVLDGWIRAVRWWGGRGCSPEAGRLDVLISKILP